MKDLEDFMRKYGFCGHKTETDNFIYCLLSSRQCSHQSEYQFPYANKGGVGGRMYLCQNKEYHKKYERPKTS